MRLHLNSFKSLPAAVAISAQPKTTFDLIPFDSTESAIKILSLQEPLVLELPSFVRWVVTDRVSIEALSDQLTQLYLDKLASQHSLDQIYAGRVVLKPPYLILYYYVG